jgi:hypothetical protein
MVTSISSGFASPAVSPRRGAEAVDEGGATSRVKPASATVSASVVFPAGNDAAEFIRGELDSIRSVAVGLQGDRWRLANLDMEREASKLAGMSDEQTEERIASIKASAERRIADAESFLAGANERFGPGVQVSGSVVRRDENGGWQMGEFSLSVRGGGFSLSLDRENGMMVKDGSGPWRQDQDGTAALRMLEDALATPPRALNRLV